MGWKLARCGYWLVIVLGTVLLFGREQEFHILKIIFGVGLPVAFIWVCCSSFRLMLKGAASTFAEAQVGLAKVAITYPGWRKPAQSCRLPCSGDGGELPLFRGLD